MTCRSSALAERVQCEADGRLGRCSKTASAPASDPRWCRIHDPEAPPVARRSVSIASTAPRIGHAVPLYEEPTDRAAWLAARQQANTIGASDVWRILHGQALTVALERRGELERECLDDVREVQRGNDAEPHILAWAGAQKPGWVYRHPRIPCLTCTPDGVMPDGGVVEAKFTTYRSNTEAVRRLADYGPMAVVGLAPWRWWVQCQVQIAVLGAPVELAVMIGAESLADCLAGRGPVEGDMVRIPVEPDPEYIAAIETQVPAFHERFVVGDELPEPGPSDEDIRAAMTVCRERWLADRGIVVERADLEGVLDTFVTEGAARKIAGDAENEAKRLLKAAVVASGAEAVRVGRWEVRLDARGALRVTERREAR